MTTLREFGFNNICDVFEQLRAELNVKRDYFNEMLIKRKINTKQLKLDGNFFWIPLNRKEKKIARRFKQWKAYI